MSDEKKIYVVIAETVQNPMRLSQVGKSPQYCDKWILVAGSETNTITQPPGRIAAQVAHVVSRMRMNECNAGRCGIYPITTIILSVTDSYNLEFRSRLISNLGIRVYAFHDDNEDYGPGPVLTAICTVPVEREKLYGAIDYLPLWDGKTP